MGSGHRRNGAVVVSDNGRSVDWRAERAKAIGLIRDAKIRLGVACGAVMPSPEVLSMDAAAKILDGTIALLQATAPADLGTSGQAIVTVAHVGPAKGL